MSDTQTNALIATEGRMLRILAVAMLDVATFGRDQFFVETEPGEVMLYEASTAGEVRPLLPRPKPLSFVTSSIEKSNHGFRLETPVPIESLSDLPRLLGSFELMSDTSCRLRPDPRTASTSNPSTIRG